MYARTVLFTDGQYCIVVQCIRDIYSSNENKIGRYTARVFIRAEQDQHKWDTGWMPGWKLLNNPSPSQ